MAGIRINDQFRMKYPDPDLDKRRTFKVLQTGKRKVFIVSTDGERPKIHQWLSEYAIAKYFDRL